MVYEEGYLMPEDFKAIESYLRSIEERYKKLIDEKEQKCREAIEFLKQHTFILGHCLGHCNGEVETDEILRYNSTIKQLQDRLRKNFNVFEWEGQIIAIPVSLGASIRINISELLPHAKRFGESLAFFTEVDG
jgi:hypothetical protein